MKKETRTIVGWSLASVVSMIILLVMWYTVGWYVFLLPAMNLTWLFNKITYTEGGVNNGKETF